MVIEFFVKTREMETVQTPKAKTLNNKYTNKRRKQSKTTQCYISDTLSYI